MTPFVASITHVISLLTVVGDITVVIIFLSLLLNKAGWAKYVLACFNDQLWLVALLTTLGAILGSLFYSDVAGFAPCLLCWWQRVFLYPQAVLFAFGWWRKDKNIWDYSLVLSVLGFLTAAYNTYLQFGGSSLLPCPATGPSCAARYFLEFGYITIPTMSLTAFVILIALCIVAKTSARAAREIKD